MKHIFISIALLMLNFAAFADSFDYRFLNTPLPKALAKINHDHPDLDISFVHNELDHYFTSAAIHTDDPQTALRLAVGKNPVKVIKQKNRFILKPLPQRVYTGSVSGSDSIPLPYATVSLLSPDSTVVIATQANGDGYFRIASRMPCRWLCVSYMSYSPKVVRLSGSEVGEVILNPAPKELKQVFVESSPSIINSNSETFFPTSKEKKSAMGAVDLLKRMAIPQIIFNKSGGISTVSGEDVCIFINYMESSDGELEGMRTTDVRKIEFYHTTDDPRFLGKRNVVNFIVREYEYGGYTKLYASERFLTGLSNKESVYSKFSYRRMTYDVYASVYNNDNRHDGGYTRKETFNLAPDAGGSMIREQATERTRYTANSVPVTFRASYQNDKFNTYHLAGFVFENNPKIEESGNLSYVPSGASEYKYSNKDSYVQRHFNYNGALNFFFPRGFSLNLRPSTTYFTTDSRHYYASTALTDGIVTDASQTDFTAGIMAYLNKNFGRNSLSLSLAYNYWHAKVEYTGSVPDRDKFTQRNTFSHLSYQYRGDSFNFYLDGGINTQDVSIDGISTTKVIPQATISAGWSINQKNSLNFNFIMGNRPMNNSHKSPNIFRENELMYYQGNPLLKDATALQGIVSYSWRPSYSFSVSPYVNTFIIRKHEVPVYNLNDNGNAVVRSYWNSGNFFHVFVGSSFTARLLSRDLQLTCRPYFGRMQSTGFYHISRHDFGVEASAYYYLGDFNFSISYLTGSKSLSENSGEVYTFPSNLTVSAGWSNGNWNVNATVYNPFRRNWSISRGELSSPYYSFAIDYSGVNYHAMIGLNASYTFGYGKKMDRGSNEVGEQWTGSSAILK